MKMSSARLIKEHDSVGNSDDGNIGKGNAENLFAKLDRQK